MRMGGKELQCMQRHYHQNNSTTGSRNQCLISTAECPGHCIMHMFKIKVSKTKQTIICLTLKCNTIETCKKTPLAKMPNDLKINKYAARLKEPASDRSNSLPQQVKTPLPGYQFHNHIFSLQHTSDSKYVRNNCRQELITD